MKQGIAVLILAVLGVGLWAFSTTPVIEETTSEPFVPLTGFSPDQLDLEEHPWGTKVEFSTTFVNNEEYSLKILSVKTSCSCTVMEHEIYAGKILQPGGQLEISGTVNTGEKAGARRTNVSITATDDLEKDEQGTAAAAVDSTDTLYELNMVVRVYQTYMVKPTALNFKNVNLEDEAVPADQIMFTSKTAQITKVKTEVSWADIALEDMGNGRTAIHVQLRKEDLRPGFNTGGLTIFTDDKHRESYRIPIICNLQQHLRVNPTIVFLYNRDPKTVRFAHKDGSLVELEGISCELEAVSFHMAGNTVSVQAVGAPLKKGTTVPVWVSDQHNHRVKFLLNVVKDIL